MTEELIPIVMFVSIAVVLIAAFWFRQRSRDGMQQTIRLAIDKGHELTPEIIDRLGHPQASKYKDLRLGMIWMALAIGLLLCGLAVPDSSGDALRGCLAGAAFPFAIGTAYLILYRFTGKEA
ncbi:MAG: DUF6249 domain-containing protein [Gammaproteobacteria bacterium]|nr:DUF6249 domain-containing protein [Gammaproteobacteria bacterium]